jgi:excisionase family DNA binding protein
MKQIIHPSERLLTLDEVAEELGVDRMTVYYQLLSHENLPASKVGKRSPLGLTVAVVGAI